MEKTCNRSDCKHYENCSDSQSPCFECLLSYEQGHGFENYEEKEPEENED